MVFQLLLHVVEGSGHVLSFGGVFQSFFPHPLIALDVVPGVESFNVFPHPRYVGSPCFSFQVDEHRNSCKLQPQFVPEVIGVEQERGQEQELELEWQPELEHQGNVGLDVG